MEKQKILSSSRSTKEAAGVGEDCRVPMVGETSTFLTPKSIKPVVSSASRVDLKQSLPGKLSKLASANIDASTGKHLSTGAAKKPMRSSASFFDRYT